MTIVLYRNEIEQRLRVHIKRHHEEERNREGVITGYLGDISDYVLKKHRKLAQLVKGAGGVVKIVRRSFIRKQLLQNRCKRVLNLNEKMV